MHSITILSANKIKEIMKLHKKKYRDEKSLFIAEGYKAIEEIINSNIKIKDIYAKNTFEKNLCNMPITYINDDQLKKITTTDSPCEIIAIAEKKNTDINLFKKLKKLILLENISDPGNLGTIIRSASAFEAEGIILYGNCTELYSPKVIRSTTGNFFKVPILEIKNLQELEEYFPTHKIIATALSKENNIEITECKKEEKYIIMFGSEATGLSQDLIKKADKNIKLKMQKEVESLNLAISVSIVLYELYK